MKENDKVLILKLLLKATFILLAISVMLKLLGLNAFGANTSNKILIDISDFIDKYYLKNIIDCSLLIVHYFIFFKLICKNKNNLIIFIFTIISLILTIILQYIFFGTGNIYISQNKYFIYFLYTLCILIVLPILIDIIGKNKIKNININSVFNLFKKQLFYIFLLTIYQILVMFLRNVTFGAAIGSLYDIILNFDYTILLISTYIIYIKSYTKVNINSCLEFNIPNIINEKISYDKIKTIIIKFKEFNKKFKESSKEDKITIVLYIIFSTISELVNLSLVIFIAYINKATIECLFIITSFLISRKIFGAFHLNSAIKCWMLSNISFYILSKLSVSIGTTYVIPILCGIGLSYVTSKFIKKNSKCLYKGMKEKYLEELSENKKLTKLEFEILKNYYCQNINVDKMTFTFHYSRAQLYRYKSNAETKINN